MGILVKGRNAIAQLKVDGVFYPVFCAKGATFTSVQEVLETTSLTSGPDREYVPAMRSHTLDVNGITQSNNTNSRVGVLYLIQNRRTTFEMRLLMTDDNGLVIAVTFNAFSTTLSISRETASYSQSSASFQITGPVAIDTTITPPVPLECEVQDPLYLTLAESATSVSNAALEVDDVVIIHVEREGLGHDETTGTPGNREFKFTGGAGNGTISFDATNPGNPGGETIYVLYKLDP
jgi:hypothetical protein